MTSSEDIVADSITGNDRAGGKKGVELEEIEVRSIGRRMSMEGTSVIPNRQQQRAATNGFDLVRRLGIPQLLMTPGSEAFQTLAGNNVSVFINYTPANKQDVMGLDTHNVEKVEYFEFPSDPRFGGQQYVLNFMVREIEKGGYTRVIVASSVYGNKNGAYGLYSKYYRNNITYDFNAGCNYKNEHHGGGDYTEIFKLQDENGGYYEQIRRQTTDRYRIRGLNLPLSFRVKYAKENILVANTVSYTWSNTPVISNDGSLLFYPGEDGNFSFGDNSSGRGQSVGWKGDYYFGLAHGLSLTLTPRIAYSRYNNRNSYITSDSYVSDLINNNRDKAFNSSLELFFRKQLNKRFMMGLSASVTFNHNDVEYWGSNPYQNEMSYVLTDFGVDIRGKWRYIYLTLWSTLMYNSTSVNGQSDRKVSPFVSSNFAWMPNSRHRLQVNLNYTAVAPGVSEKSPNIIRNNEFMYVTGNPDFHTYSVTNNSLTYTWQVNDHLTLTGFARYKYQWQLGQFIYSPYMDGSAIIRREQNSGYWQELFSIIQFRYAFNEKFVLSGYPRYYHQNLSGANRNLINGWGYYVSIDCYFGKFNITGWFERTDKTLIEGSGAVMSVPNTYGIKGGWAGNGLNISMHLKNPFTYSWLSNRRYFSSPFYSYFMQSDGNNMHCWLSLNVSYTFRYGKQKNDNSEIGAGRQAQSGVLK